MTRDPMSRSRPLAGGFTLVEILMVVVILGIASAVIIPQIGSRDDRKCAAAARVVMADLIYAQNRAIAVQKKHYVRFSGSSYSVYDSTDLLTPVKHPVNKDPYTVILGPGATNGLGDVTITSSSFGGETIVGFDELGTPFALNPATKAETALAVAGEVRLACGPIQLTIAVEPFTGEAIVR